MALLISPSIKAIARSFMSFGKVKAFAIIDKETAEVVSLEWDANKAVRYLKTHNIYDDERFLSSIVKLQEVLSEGVVII